MNILLDGRGKLGQAVKVLCEERGIRVTTPQGSNVFTDKKDGLPNVAIYCGKGNLFQTTLEWCESANIPLINASTDVGELKPKRPKCIFIDAPNASVPMVKFLSAFPSFARTFIRTGMTMSILESHQSTKTSVSGTAKVIAKQLEFDLSNIKDVRDQTHQLAIGVPQEHLAGHAYHVFTFTGQGVQIEVKTKIHGRQTYAEGLLVLAALVTECQATMEHGIYPVTALL